MACINYPPERWVLYRLAPDPALLLSIQSKKKDGWRGSKRERGREMGDGRIEGRQGESEREREGESDPLLP